MKTLLLLIAFVAAAAAASAEDFALIASPGVADRALNAGEVKNILLGTKTNWSNAPLKLVIQASGPIHEKVIQQFTQRAPDQFDKFWKKQVFTGKGTMPAIAKSDADVVAFVAANPGGFGYVDKAAVTNQVKVIEVN